MEEVGVMEHEGIMKVGVANMPEAHSIQVLLSTCQYSVPYKKG
jgi:hypothetical protein